MKYDVLMYFYWAPAQVVHKYLSFHKKLSSFCKVLTIIGEGEFGISQQLFSRFGKKDTHGVHLASMKQALEILSEHEYKIAIFSSNGRKGYVNPDGTEPPPLGALYPKIGKDVAIAKSKGAKTIQISEMITDFYYAGADVASLVSPAMRDIHLSPHKFGTHHRYQWRPFDASPEPEYIYSNCLLWDRTGDTLPYMSRKEFCDKYNLNPNKDIFVYLPSKPQHVMDGVAKRVYSKVCSLDNVVVKFHPTEYMRLAAGRLDNKWSHELCGVPNVSVLEPIDTHWCYEYASCAMSNQSSVSIELIFYETPFLYVSPPNFALSSFFRKFGHSCDVSELENFLLQKKYNDKVENLDDFCDIIMPNRKRKSSEILANQIKEMLE